MVHERGYAGTPVLSVDVFEMRTVGGAEVRAQRISGPAESTAEFLLEALREANRPAAESSGSAMQGE
jgi:hypothetical protein